MTEYRTKYIIAVSLAIGIIFGSIGLWYQQSDAEITPETKAEMYNFIKDSYVTQGEYDKQISEIIDSMASPHIEFDGIADSIKDIREDIQELKIEIAKLKNVNTGTGTPNQGTISVTVDETCYERGEVITFQGMATPSRQLTSSIYKDKTVFEASPTTNTNSNGSFQLYWVIPDGIETGSYIAKLKDSGGKFGEITVSVRDNC